MKPADTQSVEDPSKNEAWLINNTLMKMRDAEAARNYNAMWVHFKFAFNRLMIYFREDTRIALNADWKEMVRLEQEIKKMKGVETEVSETTKEKYLDVLHQNFMDTHMAYAFYGLPRMGIVEIQGEGVFDYTKHDFEELSAIINERHLGVQRTITDGRKEKEAVPSA
jgi:hypothetical protein